MNTNGWDEYKKLVVHELERSNQRLDMMDKRLGNIEQRLTVVHTKVYMVASVISAAIAGLLNFFLNSH